MRRFVFWVLAWLTLLMGAAFAEQTDPMGTEPPDVPARGAVLIERSSGRVLYGKNANERYPMASTTKVMTALLAIENSDLDEVVTAGKNASGVTGTSIYLREGERLSMRNMLYGLMIRSGNDAAVAIAEHVAGSVPQFLEMMNRRAAELNADAHFATPNGLDYDDHSASALGLARITAKALDYGAFREIVGTQKVTIPWPGNTYDRVLENKNRLLRTLPGATGVKTGFTSKAGRCLIFSCKRGNMELIGVVLNCGSWFESAAQMIEWGFANYHNVKMFDKGDVAATVRVTGGMERGVEALYASQVYLPVADGEQPEVILELGGAPHAPISEGQTLGHALISVNGQIEASIPLLAANDVEQSDYWKAYRKVVRQWPFAG